MEGSNAVVLDPDASVRSILTEDAGEATLTLRRASGAMEQDVFSSSGTLGELAEGSELTIDDRTVGRVAQNSGSIIDC